MEAKKKFTRIGKEGKLILLSPTQIKKQAVKEIESGDFSIQEVMEKYQIIDRRSIISWMRQYSELEESEYTQTPIPIEVKRKVAYQVEIGNLTAKEAARQYQVNLATITNWRKLHSCNPHKTVHSLEMPDPPELPDNPELKASDPAEVKSEPDLLKLKIVALETMIDIAEKQFNIEIRKKAGTKR
ncbi:MAG: hypothetical protein ACHQIM_16865 [Sphingobacteriales bacterium]